MDKCPTCGQVIKTTKSKRVKVDSVVYESYNLAAKYIVSEELKLGNIRQVATVSKEISRFVSSSKEEHIMYNVYKIERV